MNAPILVVDDNADNLKLLVFLLTRRGYRVETAVDALASRGFRDVTMSAHVRNVFRKRSPVALATWLNGGGIFPPTDEDPKGRMLRLTLEWRL